MIRETFPVGLLQCNCTILGDEPSREAIVVDPGYDIPHILAALAKHQLTVRQIVVTHAHIDHIASALDLKQITGAPILYNAADLPLAAMMDEQAAWIGVETPTVKPPDHSPVDLETVSVRGLNHAEIALRYQVGEWQAVAAIPHRDLGDEAQMAGHEAMCAHRITMISPARRKSVLVLLAEHRKAVDFSQIS